MAKNTAAENGPVLDEFSESCAILGEHHFLHCHSLARAEEPLHWATNQRRGSWVVDHRPTKISAIETRVV